MNSQIMEKDRNYGIDLYRMFCMFLITSIHLDYTSIEMYIAEHSFDAITYDVLKIVQLIGVNGFIMISAYFLIESEFNWKRIVRFWFRLEFCTILVFLCATTLIGSFSVKTALKSIFPITTQHYWYPVAYLILLLVFPLLNMIINGLNRKQHLALIITWFAFQALLLSANPMFDATAYYGYSTHSIIWFIQLYFIAGYLKKYDIRNKLLLGPIAFIFLVIVSLLFKKINDKYSISALGTLSENMQLFECNGFFATLLTVSSFITFSMLKIKNNIIKKILSSFIPSSFFVYLIQEHESFRMILWNFVSRFFNIICNPVVISLIVFLLLSILALAINELYKIAYKIFISKIEIRLLSLFDRISRNWI